MKTVAVIKQYVVIFGGFLSLLLSGDLMSAESGPTRIGKYILPAAVTESLSYGMKLPVFIHYQDNADNSSDQKIADAVLMLKEGRLLISEVFLNDFASQPDIPRLSAQTEELVMSLSSRHFDDSMELTLSSDAYLKLDIKTFRLQLVVNRQALSVAMLPRSHFLAPSSIERVTSTLHYELGMYDSFENSRHDGNSYLTLNSTTGWREHHLNINAGLYGIGTSRQENTLYRAMYEWDHNGRRFAAGMVDLWNLQSLAQISALSTRRVYGFSYGNQANTKIKNNSLSLTPITAFLPSAGEVRIYRDDRLVSLQSFPMGSFEVDTSSLPYGIYDVQVETISDGKVITKTTQRVNKSFGDYQVGLNEIAWQLFGGYTEVSLRQKTARNYSYQEKNTYLAGVSIAKTWAVFDGLSFSGSLYSFDQQVVSENELSLNMGYGLQVGRQNLIANDSSWRLIYHATYSLPGGYGSLWGNYEKGLAGDQFLIYDSHNYSYGGTLNIGHLLPHSGVLTTSYTKNLHNNYTSLNADYSMGLMSGRFGQVNLRTGIQRYRYSADHQSTQKYISLDFSIPINNWISLGVSRRDSQTVGNLRLQKSFNNSVITSAGMNISQPLSGTNSNQTHINTNATFESKYTSGSVSVSHFDRKYWHTTLNTKGTVGLAGSNWAVSGLPEANSGLIIRTGLTDNSELAAKINEKVYRLNGRSNFIPLSPYGTYTIELMNNKNSMDSFEIVDRRRSQLTLYPGNIGVLEPEIKQLVTVFGRLKLPSGIVAANADIRNHIGKTRTDDNGDFALDIDKRFPVISLITLDSQSCEAELDLTTARGVYWAGDIVCIPSTRLASAKQ